MQPSLVDETYRIHSVSRSRKRVLRILLMTGMWPSEHLGKYSSGNHEPKNLAVMVAVHDNVSETLPCMCINQ